MDFNEQELKVLLHLVNRATFTGIQEAGFVLALDAKLKMLLEEVDGDTADSSE